MTLVNYPAGTDDIITAYDNNSNPVSVTRGGSVWTYAWNDIDLMTEEKLVIDSRTYEFDYGYNSTGFLQSRARAGGPAVSFAPDGHGRPTKAAAGASDYLSGATYHPNGTVAGVSYGNGLALTQNLNTRQLVSEIKHAASGANTVRLTYGHDARGMITSITDHVVAGSNRAFTYDANGRLLTASGSWGSGSYKYDALANIRQRDIGARTVNVAYDATKNRVSTVTDTANPSRTFTHDARGNVTDDGRSSFTYDLADQPVSASASGVSAAYAYDGNKKRVKSVVNHPAGGAKTTYFVYSALSGGLVFKDEILARTTDYLAIGPAQVRLLTARGTTAPDYIHSDHLGSAVAATTGAGALLWREGYMPFGEKLLDPTGNRDDTGFTGHIDDDLTGLTYMQARYYDPVIGRFYSTDPIDYQDQLNLYAYVANDPINKIDPDGQQITGAVNVGPAIQQACGGSMSCQVQVGQQALKAEGAVLAGAASLAVPGPEDLVIAAAAAKYGGALIKGGKAADALTPCCFVAGTLVETENGLKPIQTIKVGDKVWARDVSTGETLLKAVTNVTPRHDRGIWEVTLAGPDGKTESFETTHEHPWWIAGRGWLTTEELTPGMAAVTKDGRGMTVASVTETSRTDATYNFTVADFETYFVGEQRVLVHNCPAGDMSKRFSSEKEALVDMAKGDKRTGMTPEDMQAYKDLNKDLPDPFPENAVRGPEAHPGAASPSSQAPHGHVGPVDHIPIKPDELVNN